jgi:hypothetical protein
MLDCGPLTDSEGTKRICIGRLRSQNAFQVPNHRPVAGIVDDQIGRPPKAA